jgi:hypothetical protein
MIAALVCASASNAITDNAITDNAITDNAITDIASGLLEALQSSNSYSSAAREWTRTQG